MKPGSKLFLLFGLLFFVAGCGGYRTVAYPFLDDPGITAGEADEDRVEEGDRLRVTLDDGAAYRGKLVACARDTLFLEEEWLGDGVEGLEPPVRVGHSLPVSRVTAVERYDAPQGGLIVLGLGVVIAAGFIVGNSIQNSLDWGDGLFSE